MTGMFISAGAEEAAYQGPDSLTISSRYKVSTQADYDPLQLKTKWGNGYLDAADPTDEDEIDKSCSPGRFFLETDPTNAENKALLVDCIPNSESFYYITVKDDKGALIQVKNFEVSFKFKLVEGAASACWFGIACRKDADTRFNGCNNVMMTARFWNTTGISPYGQRNLGQSGINITYLNEDRTGDCQAYATDDVYAEWYTYKLVAENNKFDMYINDSHIGGCDIKQTSSNKPGYLSFVSCVSKVYIDDFRVTNNDTVPPVDPPAPDSSTSASDSSAPASDEAPVLTDGGTFKIGQGSEESVSVGLDTKGQEIVKIDRDNRAVLGSYFTYEDGRLTLTKEYIKILRPRRGRISLP